MLGLHPARINPKSGLCPACDEFVQGVNRRVDSIDRRHQARDQSRDARRDLGQHHDSQDSDSGTAPPPPPGNNLFNFPNPSNTNHVPLPNVDLNDIIKNCEAAKSGAQVDTGKVLGDMMGMMVHMFAKQTENEAVKVQVHSNTDRISHLEAKVGDSNDVAYPRSIAMRKLPLPPHGVTELQNVQHYLKEINAEGVDVTRDCIKAIRKESMQHNPNMGPNLGTVLVELKSEEIRGKIMRSKKNLTTNPALVLQNLIIVNAMTPAEMKAKNTHLGMLKMITGNDNFFIAGNGSIRQKDPQSFQNGRQAPQGAPQPRHNGHHASQTPRAPQTQPQAPQPSQFPQTLPGPSQFQAPKHFPQQQQNPNHFPAPVLQQGRPTFQTNFPPPQFKPAFPYGLPAMPPAQAIPKEIPAVPVVDLLNFEFAPVDPLSVSRPGSARSDLSSPDFDRPSAAQHHERPQAQ